MIEISKKLFEMCDNIEKKLEKQFKEIDKVCERNTLKVLNAFSNNSLAYSDFAEVNGYAFFDTSRDKLEKIFAEVLGAEDSLVRPQIMSGTNAIYITLSALLRCGDCLLCISGLPYDPLQEIVGVRGNSSQSLVSYGVVYKQIDLVQNDFDYAKIEEYILKFKPKVVEIQRSCGYEDRKGLSISQIKNVCSFIKNLDKNIIIMCDNCYGELVEELEPTQVGVDVMSGSLMHNLGGGIATSGGYIAGKNEIIEQVADRLTSPGLGRYLGADYNQKIKYFKGLFMAPRTVANAVKSALLISALAEEFKFDGVCPKSTDKRSDIIQTFNLPNERALIEFCNSLQCSSPVDSFYYAEPFNMPSYSHQEVMSAGTFTQGSTIELTCDAPICSPYKVFVQGGLTYESSKLAILSAFTKMLKYTLSDAKVKTS